MHWFLIPKNTHTYTYIHTRMHLMRNSSDFSIVSFFPVSQNNLAFFVILVFALTFLKLKKNN